MQGGAYNLKSDGLVWSCTCVGSCTHHTQTHTHCHFHTHTHTHTHTHSHKHTYTPHLRTLMHTITTHTHSTTYTHLHLHTLRQIYSIHTCTLAHKLVHTHTHTHLHTYTLTHLHTHTHIHTYTHSHTNTHTHTHIMVWWGAPVLLVQLKKWWKNALEVVSENRLCAWMGHCHVESYGCPRLMHHTFGYVILKSTSQLARCELKPKYSLS